MCKTDTTHMIYKLQNIKTTDLSELRNEIKSGAKFHLFNYRIGLGFVSLQRFSPAILIKQDDEIEKFKKKYNRINLIFGPWFIFKGPFLTYDAYKTNKNGGIDVTKDIMTNLTQEHLLNNQVEIIKIHNIFSKVSKTDKKSVKKAIKLIDLNLVPLKKIYTGLFINVEEYQEPYLVIGIELYKDVDLNIEHIKACLYKVFYKHVDFEIIRINDRTEFEEKLIEQGELIYGT